MSQPAAWNDIFAIFERLLEKPPQDRLAELERLTDDPLVRKTVRELLEAHEEDVSLFDRPVAERLSDLAARGAIGAGDHGDTAVGRVLGAYRLVRRIGRGGMSTAYLAERVDGAYERAMVVKVVRSDRESPLLLERLEAERRILAGLEHPSIASLYDGGTTDEGRPYFVMEHVPGVPIDVYCETSGLGVIERLRLFVQVCDAVRSAHRKLIVHLDIKPSNILVTSDGTPKLLDFGIARLLEPDPDDPRRTRAVDSGGHRMLTPSFASPEQIRGEPITTAADVYSLGVLLYLLLAGRLPRRVEGRSVEEVERALSDEAPHKPSAVDTEIGDAPVPHLAGSSVRRSLRDDLDAIVLKALRIDPNARYPSVESLVEEIERALQHRPVEARGDGWLYIASRFVRRNRMPVAFATLLLLLVSGFAVAMGVQAKRVARERDKKAQVVELIEQVFTRGDPWVARDADLTVLEALEQSLPIIERGLDSQPEVRGELLHTTGSILSNLGEHPRAIEQLEEALEVREKTLGPDHPEVATTLRRLAASRREQLELEAAESLTRRAIEIYRKNGDIYETELSLTLLQLASIFCYREMWDSAEPLAEEVLSLTRQAEAVESIASRAAAYEYLAQIEGTRGFFENAVEHSQRALDLYRELYGEAHPKQIVALSNLGLRLRRAERFDEAVSTYEEALAMQRKVFGENSDDPALLNNLAAVYRVTGQYMQADEIYRRALQVVEEQYDNAPWMVQGLTLSLAQVHLAWSESGLAPTEVERELRALIDLKLVADDHWLEALGRSILGDALSHQGRCAAAGQLLSSSFQDLVTRNKRARVRHDAVDRLRKHRERCGDAANLEGGAFEAVPTRVD